MDSKRKFELGHVYSAKVGKTYAPVQVVRSLGHGRYEGVNMLDSTAVKISTTALKGTGETAEKWHARQRPQEREVAAPAPTSPALAVPPATDAASAPAKPKRGKRIAAAPAKVVSAKTAGTATDATAEEDQRPRCGGVGVA